MLHVCHYCNHPSLFGRSEYKRISFEGKKYGQDDIQKWIKRGKFGFSSFSENMPNGPSRVFNLKLLDIKDRRKILSIAGILETFSQRWFFEDEDTFFSGRPKIHGFCCSNISISIESYICRIKLKSMHTAYKNFWLHLQS